MHTQRGRCRLRGYRHQVNRCRGLQDNCLLRAGEGWLGLQAALGCVEWRMGLRVSVCVLVCVCVCARLHGRAWRAISGMIGTMTQNIFNSGRRGGRRQLSLEPVPGGPVRTF